MEPFEVLDFIGKYTKSGRPVTDLSRFAGLMRRLGDPQRRLRFVHVAGTNGKGSVVRMIAETFGRAGYLTGEYVSPYIYRYNDRIKINGGEIPDRMLCDVAEKVIPIIRETGEAGYSQFEITTAFAFTYFAMMKCDVVVLETGLGGLLDCTNIIEDPLCSVITSISYDHTAVLGTDITSIASHKAGIIKRGCPCVMQAGNPPEAVREVIHKAHIENSELIIPDETKIKNIVSTMAGNDFTYKGKKWHTGMAGRHQIYNAVTAIETLMLLSQQYDIAPKDIYEGIASAEVPSRCQIISDKGPVIILDGAHNPGGIAALAELIGGIRAQPKVLVCGMLETKDWKQCAQIISPCVDKVYCVDGFFSGAVFAPKLAECFENAEVSSLREAYYKAAVYAGDNGLVVIAGSLYLASALQRYGNYGG